MKTKQREHAYALETTGLFVSGLGMLLLVLVSAWMMAMVVSGGRRVADEFIGSAPNLSLDRSEIAALGTQIGDQGRVAGVLDDSSGNEQALRNNAAEWLSDARLAGNNTVAYRDNVLDRNAQNHARLLADKCSDEKYNSWEDTLGAKTDEGYIRGFSESLFLVNGESFASELPQKQVDYQRLFTNIDAYGVGVAKTAAGCSDTHSFVFHVAEVN